MSVDMEVLTLAMRTIDQLFGKGVANSYCDFIRAAESPCAQFQMRQVLQDFAATNPTLAPRGAQPGAIDTSAVRDWPIDPRDVPKGPTRPNPHHLAPRTNTPCATRNSADCAAEKAS